MVQLDLIELADLIRPEQLVAEILRQNPQMPVPVPLEELARLAGISKIEAFTSEGFEGALIANVTKSEGAIFYSSRGPRPRQRFTIGHELGHFLLPWHRQLTFQCTAEDISSRANKDWEIQANQFAAELLIPAPLVRTRLQKLKDPELAHIMALRDEFETSMEMTARRVVELSEYACAVVFSKDNDGFAAIIVAFVGRLHPVGMVFSAVLMSMFYIGGELAQSRLGLPKSLTGVFQGLLLFTLLACDTLIAYRVRFTGRVR